MAALHRTGDCLGIWMCCSEQHLCIDFGINVSSSHSINFSNSARLLFSYALSRNELAVDHQTSCKRHNNLLLESTLSPDNHTRS